MKIAWFTPFSRKSAIGRCSAGIVAELAQFASVDLWHPEASDERATSVPRVRFRRGIDADLRQLSEYDLVVYNFGNHLPFHREIFQVSRRMPGLVVLHDLVMHHFFASYFLEDLKDPQAYVNAMHRLYGERGRETALGIVSGKRPGAWESDEVVEFPFFEDVLDGALGVITHSDYLCQRVSQVFAGPVCKIPLAYEVEALPVLSRGELGIQKDDILIVTVGHLNPNKRLHSVIRALGRLGNRVPKFAYVLLGPYDKGYHEHLVELVHANHLDESVRFVGYVSDEILHSYMRHADICINLRFPAIEGASASAIEEMWHGKAVVVTDTGFYRELPDGAVVKIAPDREEEELSAALRTLLGDRAARERLGATARSFAEKHFHAKRYVQEFLKFAWQVRGSRPVLEFADRMASELRALGVASSMSVAEGIAGEAYNLFFED